MIASSKATPQTDPKHEPDLLLRVRKVASQDLDEFGVVELQRLLDCDPAIESSPVLLDAAIELTLESIMQHGSSLEDASSLLRQNYPSHSVAIYRASCLNLVFGTLSRTSLYLYTHTPGTCVGPAEPDGQGRYELQAECGRGSHAVTYRAIDRRLSNNEHSTVVAVKILPTQHLASARHEAEAILAGAVLHANVIRVHDCGPIDAGSSYIAMEYAERGSLSDWAVTSARDAVRLICEIAKGLHVAHSVGVVHGDIKPSNILLSGTDASESWLHPKLADFGVARSLRLNTSIRDAEHEDKMPVGTLGFMAPEVWGGELPTIQSDIYSLAATLRFLLTGQVSVPDGSDAISCREARVVPARLLRIVERACAAEPEGRTPSAVAFAADLDAWLEHRPIPEIDSAAARLALFAKRRPAFASSALLALLATSLGAVGAAEAWSGWQYERGRMAASKEASLWHQAYQPAFSDRASVYDLASRYALARSIERSDAFDWANAVTPDIDLHASQLSALLNSLDHGSFDRILIREQMIFQQLQSKLLYPDTTVHINTQRQALLEAGLFTDEESTQLNVFEAIQATKVAILSGTSPNQDSNADLMAHLHTLVAFLSSAGMETSTPLPQPATRDPRVRLAARAAHWLSSPKMLDEPDIYAMVDREYRTDK